jgi:pSer/pThr/pTyr-binding forkhead associated (FHA) protein
VTGPQPLSAVIEDARKAGDALESTFNAPVLLILPEAITLDGDTVTVSTEQGGTAPGNFDGPQTLVVPVQRKMVKSKEPKISFGRSSICDVVLAYTPVSKHHGYFVEKLGVWQVVDVGSTNGTILDGRKVPPEGAMMRDGSVLQFGHVFARFFGARAFAQFLRLRVG